jgi:hypothetical protein
MAGAPTTRTRAPENAEVPAGTQRDSSPAVRLALLVGSWGALTALGLARLLVAAGSIDMLYGEDGSVFLPGQLRHGLVASLATPYQGYLHTTPRFAAALVAALPLADAPVATAVLAAAITAALAVFVYRAAGAWIRSAEARALLAVAMVLLPVARAEVVGNLANLQWPLLFACFWALVGGDEGAIGWSGWVVVALAALSSPVALLYAPLALVLLAGRRRSGRARTPGVFLAAGAVQLVVVLTSGGSRTIVGGGVHDPITLALRYGERVVGGLLAWPGNGRPALPGLFGLVLVGLGVALVLRRREPTDPALRRAALLIGYSVALYCAPALVTGTPSRYAYVPTLLVLSAILVTFPCSRRALAVAAAVLLVCWCTSFAASPYRVHGPSWSQAISRARSECSDPAHPVTVRVPVGPDQADGGPWQRPRFECRDLGR